MCAALLRSNQMWPAPEDAEFQAVSQQEASHMPVKINNAAPAELSLRC